MRLYGKRSIKNATQRSTNQASETRDAIVWAVLLQERYVQCKIQGSTEIVIAKWPSNWSSVPIWLRPGQSVRIVHRYGIRGFVEIVGLGQTIPTPGDGSGTLPPIDTPDDMIMAGLELLPVPQTPRLSVYVSVGTVRFSGMTHIVPPVLMPCDALVANMGLLLGSAAGVWNITSPASGFRYEMFCIDSTLAITKTTGATFTTNETKPTVPNNSLLIAYLLTYPELSAITQREIVDVYEPPIASEIRFTNTDQGGGVWHIAVNIYDQYGKLAYPPYTSGWVIKLSISVGDGTLDNNAGQTGASVLGTTNSAQYTFTFTKGIETDIMLSAEINQSTTFLSNITNLTV